MTDLSTLVLRRAVMKAMILDAPGQPLQYRTIADPEPGPGQVLVKVAACGVCRTDLHVVDGDLTEAHLPIIPGHEIVGTIEAIGTDAVGFAIGDRVGIPWLGHTCQACFFCKSQQENLCDAPRFTGYHINGGYAEYTVAEAAYCFALPGVYSDVAAAPLLCAGLIGHRALRMTGDPKTLGIYGFGAAAHIVAQVARFEARSLCAFTRPGDASAQAFARRLGCTWAGGSDDRPPENLDAAIIFAPVGGLVPRALQAVRKGGIVVLGGIHMSEIPAMPYSLLWGERVVRSVANLTRRDAQEFLATAARVPITTETLPYALSDANIALRHLREGRLTGAAVLVPGESSLASAANAATGS
jgi:propanol-preferring alcohol dehydrogenase